MARKRNRSQIQNQIAVEEPIQFSIYVICCPVSGNPVYVGQTSNFEQRKRSHLRIKKRPNIGTENIKTWIWDQISIGMQPSILILESELSEFKSLERETYWIIEYSKKGFPLLNRWKEHRKIIKSYKRMNGLY